MVWEALKSRWSRIANRLVVGEGGLRRAAFTLPEVIVSFSIMAMVIASAVGLLSVVIRTNSDNVNSLVANGLAQEGIEAVRFIRDSNQVLGLDFDGGKVTQAALSPWGEKLFEAGVGVQYFILTSNGAPMPSCTNTAQLADCLPVQLEKIEGVTDDLFSGDGTNGGAGGSGIPEAARVYFEQSVSGDVNQGNSSAGAFHYFQQGADPGITSDARATQYSRVIRIEPLKSKSTGISFLAIPATTSSFDVLRVSSIVIWNDSNNRPKKLVLSTDLTDWQ